MTENTRRIKSARDHSKIKDKAASPAFREVGEKKLVVAFLLGMSIIVACILLGRSHAFYIYVLVLSLLITLIWRKVPRPWVYLTSIAAATPIPLFRQQFASNLIFAVWFVILNFRYLSKLPRWILVITGLMICGFVTSSLNWLSGGIVSGLLKQGAFFFNFGLAPLILVPMIYMRMKESRDYKANLQGLLFYLIVPSTVILLLAKFFGTQVNIWEASLHAASGAEGYIEYQLGKAIIDFSRTGIGYILAVLICASTAITISPVKVFYRLFAGACLAVNIFMLLTTGSFGSIAACLCGLTAIFYVQFSKINMAKVFLSIAIICLIFLQIYLFLPQSTKVYLGKRYEHRIVKGNADRPILWARAIDYFLKHPGGVGLTYTVGDRIKSNPHNEYLVYAVSYGFLGGIAYISLVVGLLLAFFRRRKRIKDEPYALAVYLAGLGIIVAIAVNSMTDNVGVNRWYFNIMWSVVWYCYFCSRAADTGIVRKNMTRKSAVVGTEA